MAVAVTAVSTDDPEKHVEIREEGDNWMLKVNDETPDWFTLTFSATYTGHYHDIDQEPKTSSFAI